VRKNYFFYDNINQLFFYIKFMQNHSTSSVLPFNEQEDSTPIQQLPTEPTEDNTMIANYVVALQAFKTITVWVVYIPSHIWNKCP